MGYLENGQILRPPEIHGMKERLSSVIGMMSMQTYLCEIEMIRIAQVDPLGSGIESDIHRELRASLSEFCTEMHKLAIKCEVSASVAEEYLLRRTILSTDDSIEDANIVDPDLAANALETAADICFHSSQFGIMEVYVNVVDAQPTGRSADHCFSSSDSAQMVPKKMWTKRFHEQMMQEENTRQEQVSVANLFPENEDSMECNEYSALAEKESGQQEESEEVVVNRKEEIVLPPLPTWAVARKDDVVYEHVVEEEGPYSAPSEWNEVVEDPRQQSINCKESETVEKMDSFVEEQEKTIQQKLEQSMQMIRENERRKFEMAALSGDATTDGPQVDNQIKPKPDCDLNSSTLPNSQVEHFETAVAPPPENEGSPVDEPTQQPQLSPAVEIAAPPPPPRQRRRDGSSSNNGMLDEIPLPPPPPAPRPVSYDIKEPDANPSRHRAISHSMETPRVVELLSDDDEPLGERTIMHYRSPPPHPPDDYHRRAFDEWHPNDTPMRHYHAMPRDHHRDMPHPRYLHSPHPPHLPPLMSTYPGHNAPYWPYHHPHPAPSTPYTVPFEHAPSMYHTPPLYPPHREYDPYVPFLKPHRFKKHEFRGFTRRLHYGDNSDERDKKKKRFRSDGKQ